MKRSEVLEEIRKIIHEHRRATQGVTSNEIGSMVLDKIEELGMLPPNNCSKKCHEEEYENCGHVWEPEDNYCGAV